MSAKTDVLIVGGGPVGLMAAYCLLKHGIKVRLIEKLAARTPYSKALGIQPHTVEIFAQLSKHTEYSKTSSTTSLLSQLLQRSVELEAQHFYSGGEFIATMHLDVLKTMKLAMYQPLLISQREVENVFEIQLKEEFGFEVDRGWELKEIEGLSDKSVADKLVCHLEKVHFTGKGDLSTMGIDYADAHWNDTVQPLTGAVENAKMTIEASWLIAADGSHSTVRHALKVPFKGVTTPSQYEMADVFLHSTTAEGDAAFKPKVGDFSFHNHPDGTVLIIAWPTDYGATNVTEAPTPENSMTYRVALKENKPTTSVGTRVIGRSDADFLHEIERRLLPLKMSFGSIIWKTQFCINERKVDEYRHRGRIFLAGDAAHVHSPAGGFGMNTGMQDAYNLAWKLALVIKQGGEKKLNIGALLDSYTAEREPIATSVLASSGRLDRDREAGGGLPIYLRKLVTKTVFATIRFMPGSIGLWSNAMKSQFNITFQKSPIIQAQRELPAVSLVDWVNPFSWLRWLFTAKSPRVLQGQYFRNCAVVPHGGTVEEELYHHFGYSSFTMVVFAGRSSIAEIVSKVGAATIGRFDRNFQTFVVAARCGSEGASAEMGESLKVFCDAGGKVHSEFGISVEQAYVYLVRPDGYVGFQGELAEFDQLESYLIALTSS